MERICIVVYGVVQGVGYRYNTRLEASKLDLTGYVQNSPDGTVLILAEGASQSLQQLLAWAKQGPPAARVSNIEVTFSPANGEFGDFSIKR